jgi:hypothetical protein
MLTDINPALIAPCQYDGRALDESVISAAIAAYDPNLFDAITVRPDVEASGRYILIDGHHRLEIAKRLHLATIAATVLDMDAAAALLLSVSKNNARNTDAPVTRGRAYLQLIAAGHSKAASAQALNTTVQTAEQYADLARLDPRVLELHLNGELPLGACALIARIPGLSQQRSGQYSLALAYHAEVLRHAKNSTGHKYSLADFERYCHSYAAVLARPKQNREQAILCADDENEQEERARRETEQLARAGALKSKHAALLDRISTIATNDPAFARAAFDLLSAVLDIHEPDDTADIFNQEAMPMR